MDVVEPKSAIAVGSVLWLIKDAKLRDPEAFERSGLQEGATDHPALVVDTLREDCSYIWILTMSSSPGSVNLPSAELCWHGIEKECKTCGTLSKGRVAYFEKKGVTMGKAGFIRTGKIFEVSINMLKRNFEESKAGSFIVSALSMKLILKSTREIRSQLRLRSHALKNWPLAESVAELAWSGMLPLGSLVRSIEHDRLVVIGGLNVSDDPYKLHVFPVWDAEKKKLEAKDDSLPIDLSPTLLKQSKNKLRLARDCWVPLLEGMQPFVCFTEPKVIYAWMLENPWKREILVGECRLIKASMEMLLEKALQWQQTEASEQKFGSAATATTTMANWMKKSDEAGQSPVSTPCADTGTALTTASPGAGFVLYFISPDQWSHLEMARRIHDRIVVVVDTTGSPDHVEVCVVSGVKDTRRIADTEQVRKTSEIDENNLVPRNCFHLRHPHADGPDDQNFVVVPRLEHSPELWNSFVDIGTTYEVNEIDLHPVSKVKHIDTPKLDPSSMRLLAKRLNDGPRIKTISRC